MVCESDFQVKTNFVKIILAAVVDVIISRVLLLLLVKKLVITCLKCAKLEPFFMVSGGKVLWQASIVSLLLCTFHFLTVFVLTCINTSHAKLAQLTTSHVNDVCHERQNLPCTLLYAIQIIPV